MKVLVQIEDVLERIPKPHELLRGQKVTRFTIAVNKRIRRNDEITTITDWYNVEAWDYNAPHCKSPAEGRSDFPYERASYRKPHQERSQHPDHVCYSHELK